MLLDIILENSMQRDRGLQIAVIHMEIAMRMLHVGVVICKQIMDQEQNFLHLFSMRTMPVVSINDILNVTELRISNFVAVEALQGNTMRD